MTIKDFFTKHSDIRLSLQHMVKYEGCWLVRVYNTLYDTRKPIFEEYIADTEVNAKENFDEAIMEPIINWWNNR